MKGFVKKHPLLIGIAALALILASGSYAARAEIEIISDNYLLDVKTSSLGVEIFETDYELTNENFGENCSPITELSYPGIGKGVSFDKKYAEYISIRNSGDYEEYIRVTVTKSWINSDSSDKDTTLSPDYIKIGGVDSEDWLEVQKPGSKEQTVFYYKKPVAVGDIITLSDSITIDGKAANASKYSQKEGEIITTFNYEGKSFMIEIDVDGVQARHGKEAILGAWGMDASIDDDGTLISVN